MSLLKRVHPRARLGAELAREAGELKAQLLWPETHWRAAWVTAVDARQHRCLQATWANFNVRIVHNFDDLPPLAEDAYGVADADEEWE